MVSQFGSAAVSADVASLDRGMVRVGPLRGGGSTFDFPSFDRSSTPPRAVVRVTPRPGVGDPLAPGWADFTFGADFRKDRRSKGTSVDNGDNIIQRGLASDRSQYKLEVDRGRPACQVKGTRGAVRVSAPVVVAPDRWYTVRCERDGGRLRIVVTEYRSGGARTVYAVSEMGRIGSVSWSRIRTPLAVGGKLTSGGDVVRSATDQFNGVIGNPVLVID